METKLADTEGSFIVERAAEMATALIDEMARKAEGSPTEVPDLDRNMTLESFLSGIHCYRVHDHVQLLALLNQLEDFLKDHPQIRLIILDSIAFPFRQGFKDMALRSRLLNGIAQILRKLADTYAIAVVVTNQMTTKITRNNAAEVSTLVPALGTTTDQIL
ncbi:DNA repair protein rad51c [Chytridiales sp. JEL 0842]|nr:DNA repair protein rad51c [Chytridiales sp. JEL 0842]